MSTTASSATDPSTARATSANSASCCNRSCDRHQSSSNREIECMEISVQLSANSAPLLFRDFQKRDVLHVASNFQTIEHTVSSSSSRSKLNVSSSSSPELPELQIEHAPRHYKIQFVPYVHQTTLVHHILQWRLSNWSTQPTSQQPREESS